MGDEENVSLIEALLLGAIRSHPTGRFIHAVYTTVKLRNISRAFKLSDLNLEFHDTVQGWCARLIGVRTCDPHLHPPYDGHGARVDVPIRSYTEIDDAYHVLDFSMAVTKLSQMHDELCSRCIDLYQATVN